MRVRREWRQKPSLTAAERDVLRLLEIGDAGAARALKGLPTITTTC